MNVCLRGILACASGWCGSVACASRWCGSLCLLLAAFAVSSATTEKTDKDRPRIEGTWLVTGLSLDGKKLPEKLTAKLQAFIVFKDGKFIRYREDPTKKPDERQPETAYKVDLSKKPATIDLTEKLGKVKLGIFELSGDSLKIALGEERPTSFEDSKGVDVLILKRVK